MKYILLCGGIGSRYNNYSLPKPLNYIHGKHMIEFIVENIPSSEIFIIYNVFLDEYNFKEIVKNKFKDKTFHFACVDYLTRGAVETAYIGIKQLSEYLSNDNLVFIDNDNLHCLESINRQFDNNFIGYGIDDSEKTNYSFIEVEDEKIINIEEKKRISNKFCCGLYGFKNQKTFLDYSEKALDNNNKTNNEFYFSQIYKSIINDEKVVPVFINNTKHIGSYNELTADKLDLPKKKLRICFDLDNTLVTYPVIPNDYSTVKPIPKNILLLKQFKEDGHEIIIYTARRMATHNHNIGKVIKDIALNTIQKLEEFDIEYDELIFGKPLADIYIDDRAINPYSNSSSYFGFFTKVNDFLPNKIETNKYNSIVYNNNVILKTGPEKFMRGELYFYKNIPDELCHLFPKLLKDKIIEDKILLELEYIKAIPLFYLYKHERITFKMIDELFAILNKLHNFSGVSQNELSEINIRNNYFKKLEERFEIKENYPFTDSKQVYSEIINGLKQYYAPRLSNFIHGDFWFSNILMTYEDNYKLIDMKGQVDGILTTHGDVYYDYGKLYQSIIGYDLILNDCKINRLYIEKTKNYFLEKCKKEGLDLNYLKYVTKSLIFGTFHFLNKSTQIKENIWHLLQFEV
uniref:Nucleotidyl transferase domain-containing protein n=1 Tax=viral metagenome TaxID=1070528 RepID=A0A6C0B873_9ZZZZ